MSGVASLAAKALQEKPGNQIAGLALSWKASKRLLDSERVGGVLIPQPRPVNHKKASAYLDGCCHNNIQ